MVRFAWNACCPTSRLVRIVRVCFSPLFRREAPSFRAGRNCVPLFDYYARNVIIIGMTQKVCIERVEVRGAAPYLGMCVDTVGREMPVWSDNPQVVLDWLCDAWRCRYNQLRTRRMKWNRDRSELVPLGAVVDSRTDRQVREQCSWLASVPAMVLQSPNRIENTDWWAANKRRKTLKKQHRYPGMMPRFKSHKTDPMFVCWYNKGANAVFHRLNKHHGVVVISGQNSKEHSLPGQGCRYEIRIRVRLSQEIRPYTSIGVHPKAGYLVFVNDPLPIPRKRTGLETGIDRGCVHSLALSDGSFIDLPKNRLEKIDREIRRRQKAQARRVRQSGLSAKEYVRGGHHSNRYMQEQKRISRLYRQAHNIIDDFQQQVSRRLVSKYDLIVLEDLNLTGMGRKAKPAPDLLHPGRFLPNGQAAKRGLNHALRSASMGGIRQKLEYKTKRAYASSLLLVNPAYTSQQCSQCGHTCRENRESQAVFHCTQCGLMLNADTNAAINILQRGHEVLISGMGEAGRGNTAPDVRGEHIAENAAVSKHEPTASH